MKPPVLSRIVTSYGQWHIISDWIGNDELFEGGIEWIFLNDKPGDICPEELKAKLSQRNAQLHESHINRGRSIQRNSGVDKATGIWVEHIDGDDTPQPLCPAILNGLSADIVLTDFDVHTYADGERHTQARVKIQEQQRGEAYLLQTIMPANLIFRRDVFRSVAGYDARFEGHEDLHVFAKAILAGAAVATLDIAKQSYDATPADRDITTTISLRAGTHNYFEWLSRHFKERFSDAEWALLVERHQRVIVELNLATNKLLLDTANEGIRLTETTRPMLEMIVMNTFGFAKRLLPLIWRLSRLRFLIR